MMKILVANRGEIACRIIRTCQRLGHKTVAVYSDADRQALHVSMADEALHIGPSETTHSYLKADHIIELAKKVGVTAIHPGYGFLAENAEFVEKCTANKITFIGPSAKAMRLLGSKSQAKEIAKKCKVPLAPTLALSGDLKGEVEKVKRFGAKEGYPILVKAVAGGGGRGMRLIEGPDQILEQLLSAEREAKAFFGSGDIFIEKYIEEARHIEVQIIADTNGNVFHLYDRDCTLQRHHQKIIEEAPAPNISAAIRKELHTSALALCREAKYSNAGTVEFLLDRKGQIYFLEVNSRLQVEHPVTEAITGLDLVELQIRVASGEDITSYCKEIPTLESCGCAIECRLCAENPDSNFAPSSGRLLAYSFPSNVRIDSGYKQGHTVSHYYDSLLAKLIVHAPTRREAIYETLAALNETVALGVQTNKHFLKRLLKLPEFETVSHNTKSALQAISKTKAVEFGGVLALIWQLRPGKKSFDPWNFHNGFRLHGQTSYAGEFIVNGLEVKAKIKLRPSHEINYEIDYEIEKGAKGTISHLCFTELNGASGQFSFHSKQSQTARAISEGEHSWIDTEEGAFECRAVIKKLRSSSDRDLAHVNIVPSPLPGKILDLKVNPSDQVKAGDTLLVIESMKMEHRIQAVNASRIKHLMVQKGDVVLAGQALLELESV